jgi:hypothetical protein
LFCIRIQYMNSEFEFNSAAKIAELTWEDANAHG